jgi:hypothetical protein
LTSSDDRQKYVFVVTDHSLAPIHAGRNHEEKPC